MPATAPIITELRGETEAQGLVMATNPAKAPLRLILISGFPNLIQDVIMARTAPVAAARFVFTKIMAISLLAAVVEPGLKPNHPSQSMKTPKAAKKSTAPKNNITDHTIGEAAGEVWLQLTENEGLTVAAVKKATRCPDDVTLMAIGWLAREGKLHFETTGRSVKLTLA